MGKSTNTPLRPCPDRKCGSRYGNGNGGDGKISTENRTSIGSPLPKFTYGFNNTFSFKNFDLTLFLQGSYGNKIFNALDRDFTGMGYFILLFFNICRNQHLGAGKRALQGNNFFHI
ncbi:MAG: hypothetical protein LBD52_03890 [Prevotellaceae bacterium]|jgi:hypothetical protein|nr:hypothetical protein [Prevotellaceae bacterium]